MRKTYHTYINRLFEDEEKGKEWAERKMRSPEMKGYRVTMEWRKIKYAPEDPEIFSVSLRKEKDL